MSSIPGGPVYVGGFQDTVADDAKGRWTLRYLPDVNNDDLQSEGKAPVYYWMPESIRISQNPDTGDYKFSMMHFEGLLPKDGSGATSDSTKISGGVLSFTTTSAPPPNVLQASQDQILGRFRGSDQKYWGWRSGVAPAFAPMPVASNITAVSNLSPNPDGSLPGGSPTPTGSGSTAGSSRAPAGAPGSGGSDAPPTTDRSVVPSPVGVDGLRPRNLRSPKTVPYNRTSFRGPAGNLDMWYWRLQGAGPGSVDLLGENAYEALVGSLPAAILWAGFHGTYSPIFVSSTMKLPVWSEALKLTITGDWKRIYDGFSADVKARYLFFNADVQTAFRKMVKDGTIKVLLEIDGTLPGADEMEKAIDKRIELITQKFMDEAQKTIFDPPPPKDDPAQAQEGPPSIFAPGSVGFALKQTRDETWLDLSYHEERRFKYFQTHSISSSLEGFYNEIKADPAAERKYFTTLYLDDWERMVTRIVKPVVNWGDPSKRWVGEPVAFLSAQIGYPNVDGVIEWSGNIFQQTDPPSTTWRPAWMQKNAADVSNAPPDWTPDKTYVRRRVSFSEAPSEIDYPNVRLYIEKPEVDLDQGDNGRAMNDITLEVRADAAGRLAVGPIGLDVTLDNPKQEVEVSFQALGKTPDGIDRPVSNLLWKYSDQDQDRFFIVYTGDPKFVPQFRYQVKCVEKGGFRTKGQEWTGPWVTAVGSGPFIVTVPMPDDRGVTKRSLVPGVGATADVAGTTPPPDGAGGAPTPTAPPPTTSGATTPPPSTPVDQPPPGVATRSVPVVSGPPSDGGDPVLELSGGWTATKPSK